MTVPCPHCGRDPSKPDPYIAVGGLRLARNERRAFDRLAEDFGSFVTSDELLEAVYADRGDGGPEFADSVLTITLRRLRTKLEPVGLTVEGRKGAGSPGRRLKWVTE